MIYTCSKVLYKEIQYTNKYMYNYLKLRIQNSKEEHTIQT